jgi:hypothetical protein
MGLPSAAGDPCLHLNLYGPASITEGLSHLLPHGVPSCLGQRGQRLTGGASAALKRAVISVEGRQHEYVLLGVGLSQNFPAHGLLRRCALPNLRNLYHKLKNVRKITEYTTGI